MGVIAETADRVCVLYAGRLAEIGAVRDVVKQPQHPYTAGLMAAIPSLADDPEARLAQIPGAMPRLDAIPKGCAFHPRCAHAFARCVAERPPVYRAAASGAACFLHDPQRAAVPAGGAA
jgi:peptide/nickel transport system ATP-binding protein